MRFLFEVPSRMRLDTVFGAVILLLMFTSASLALRATDWDGKPLVVGTSANYPPVVYLQEGEIVGIEADFAQALGEEWGREIVLVDMPWEELFEALDSRRIDVAMAGISVTEDRKDRVAFAEPYLEVGQMALIRTADLGRLSAPAAMAAPGRTIGVEKGTTGQRFIEEIYPDASLRSFSSPDDGVAALRRGEVEFFVHDAPTIWTLTLSANLSNVPDIIALYTPLTRERVAWAVQKENVALVDALNAALLAMRQDGRAQRILGKWITISVTVSSPLAPVEF
jgi:ABC-type amino acid transport substrate-binding protein